jgi:hypothetical protein
MFPRILLRLMEGEFGPKTTKDVMELHSVLLYLSQPVDSSLNPSLYNSYPSSKCNTMCMNVEMRNKSSMKVLEEIHKRIGRKRLAVQEREPFLLLVSLYHNQLQNGVSMNSLVPDGSFSE